MKRWFAVLLAIVICLSLAACGGGDKGSALPGSSGQEQQPGSTPDPGSQPDETPDNEDYGMERFGLALADITPEGSTGWEVTSNNDLGCTINFTMPGNVSEEEGHAYKKKIYDLTASISEGGVNYKETGGTPVFPEVGPMGAWEDERSETGGYVNLWYYKYDGKLLKVWVAASPSAGEEISMNITDFT